jgi:hypothetical protein
MVTKDLWKLAYRRRRLLTNDELCSFVPLETIGVLCLMIVKIPDEISMAIS